MRTGNEQGIGTESGQSVPNEEPWDQVSSVFLEGRSSIGSIDYGPLSPSEQQLGLLRGLVGDVRGLDVLEAGCGGGHNAECFATQGARVTAVDLSSRQLAHAERVVKRAGVQVTLLQANVEKLEGLPDTSYDLVFCAHVLPYVESVKQALASFRRVLREGGWLVASIDHPFRSCFYDADDSSLTNYAERSYYARGPRSWRFSGTDTSLYSFDRTVGDWVALLHEAGLPLRSLLEPPVPVDVLDDLFPEDGPLATMRNIPHTLVFAAGGPPAMGGSVRECS